MSYILDALKKSDSERQQRQAPTLASVQQQHFFYQSNQRNWAGYIVGGLLLALAGAGAGLYASGYIVIGSQQGSGDAAPLVASQTEVDAVQAPAATVPLTTKPEPVRPQAAQPAPDPAPTPQTHRVAQEAPPLANIPELWQLPSAQRVGLPALDFSLHVYSTQQDQRSIIINNRMMREGERVTAELGLHAITPDGVVMKYRNEYFRVGIVDNW